MRVDVVNQTRRTFPSAQVVAVAGRAARLFHLPQRTRVSVTFVGDREMRALNRRTRRINRPTDVLSFPLHRLRDRRRARLVADPDGWVRLGDIVVSLEAAVRTAAARGVTRADECSFLVAHGLLHLLGFDHRAARDERRMDRLTDRLTHHLL